MFGGTASAGMPGWFDIRPARTIHVVKPGETLASVAQIHGADPAVLHMMNRHTVAGNGVIHPGMRLEV